MFWVLSLGDDVFCLGVSRSSTGPTVFNVKGKQVVQPDPRQALSCQYSALAEYAGTQDSPATLVKRVLEGISDVQIAGLQERYKAELDEFEAAGEFKYLDLPYWTYFKLRLARELGLDKAPSLSILDLGAGAGHFARICNHFGHSITSLDVEVRVYEDIARLLNVQRTIIRIEPEMPLPNFDRKFDLITAIAINFHQIEWNMRHWSLDQWKFLFNDLVSRQLRFPGRIYFELNKEYRGDRLVYNPEVLEFCARNGAAVSEGGVIKWEFERW